MTSRSAAKPRHRPDAPLAPTALFASGFGLGYLPLAPGTWGSLLGLPLAAGLARWPWPQAVLGAALATGVAVGVASRAEARFGGHDASYIVIDEVVGMAIALLGQPVSWSVYLVGFGLFRLFDALKPGPVGWVDRRIGGGLGVVLDDVVAGVLAGLVLAALRAVLPWPWP